MSKGQVQDSIIGNNYALYHGDSVLALPGLPDASVGLSVSSWPFSDQYAYSPSPNDFGNCDGDDDFFAQMDYLLPELLRVTIPGRFAIVHCKDRIIYGSRNDGWRHIEPFSDKVTTAMRKHGWLFFGRITVATDPVRENAQTNNLPYSELQKDASRFGAGMPEYLLLFRRPHTKTAEGGQWSDQRVTLTPEEYTLPRWQIDANSLWRSDGKRKLMPWEEDGYSYERHIAYLEELDRKIQLGRAHGQPLPTDNPFVWWDISRIKVLNGRLAKESEDEKHICLARGSLVLTYERGYIPIEEVQVGQQVLTHEGRWKPVTAKRCNGVREVIRTTAQGVADLQTTPDHKLWTRKARTAHPRKIARETEPTWIEAQKTLGSYVNLKLPPVEESHLTAEEWWVIGRWLGDGHRDGRGRLHISCGAHELEELVERLGDYVGAINDTGTSYQIAIKDRNGRLREQLSRCGHGAAGKVLPGEALALEPVKAEALLSGYLSADGHYVPRYDRWTASSVSRALLLGMAMVAQRARGVVASVYAGREGGEDVICGRAVSTQDEWVLSIPPRNLSAMMLDDGAWKKVRRLEEAGEAEVWDIQVADDESFTAEGCIVHNCPLQTDLIERCITRWSNKGDIVLDYFAGIGSVPFVAMQHGRRGVGIELKRSYYLVAARYLDDLEIQLAQPTLFDLLEEAA